MFNINDNNNSIKNKNFQTDQLDQTEQPKQTTIPLTHLTHLPQLNHLPQPKKRIIFFHFQLIRYFLSIKCDEFINIGIFLFDENKIKIDEFFIKEEHLKMLETFKGIRTDLIKSFLPRINDLELNQDCPSWFDFIIKFSEIKPYYLNQDTQDNQEHQINQINQTNQINQSNVIENIYNDYIGYKFYKK